MRFFGDRFFVCVNQRYQSSGQHRLACQPMTGSGFLLKQSYRTRPDPIKKRNNENPKNEELSISSQFSSITTRMATFLRWTART